MFTPMIYLYMYNAVDHNKSFLSQQSLIISTLLSSFTLQTQQHLLKISQGTNVTLLPRLNNYLIKSVSMRRPGRTRQGVIMLKNQKSKNPKSKSSCFRRKQYEK